MGIFTVNSEDEVVIGMGAGAHVGVGGHVRVGFNLSEFARRLFD